MTLSTVISGGAWATRKLMLFAALASIGLFVGFAAVLLPPAVPLGIVGLAGLVLLWVLPDLQKVPYRFARMMFFPFIVSAISIPVYFAIIVPGLPWISIRRVILFTFASCVIITLSTSSKHRSQIISVCKLSPLLSFFIFGYYCIILLSAFQSVSIPTSINDIFNTTLTTWIPLVAAMLFINNERIMTAVFAVFVSCLVFDGLMGAIEARLGHPFLILALPPFMRSQMIAQNPMYAGMLTGGHRNGIYRAVSTYNVALSWGEMSAFMAPVAAYFVTEGRSKVSKTFGVVGMLASLGSVILAGSRGGYVGLIAALLIYFAIWGERYRRNRPASLVGGSAIVVYAMGAIVVIGAVLFVPRIHNMVLGGSDTQASNDVRRLQWQMAWPHIISRPVLGHGPGTAGDVVGYVNQAGIPTLDSYLINVLVDTGFVGLVFFAAIYIMAIILCLKAYFFSKDRFASFLGSIGCALSSYALYRTTLTQTENNTTIFIMLGSALALFALYKENIRSQAISRTVRDERERIPDSYSYGNVNRLRRV